MCDSGELLVLRELGKSPREPRMPVERAGAPKDPTEDTSADDDVFEEVRFIFLRRCRRGTDEREADLTGGTAAAPGIRDRPIANGSFFSNLARGFASSPG
jgi:hypothetical protein